MGMKVKEAILTLNANAVIACERAGFSSATVKMIEDALDTIEDALKEKEPIKPKNDAFGHPYCPRCKVLVYQTWNYCPHCGREVKWDADGETPIPG